MQPALLRHDCFVLHMLECLVVMPRQASNALTRRAPAMKQPRPPAPPLPPSLAPRPPPPLGPASEGFAAPCALPRLPLPSTRAAGFCAAFFLRVAGAGAGGDGGGGGGNAGFCMTLTRLASGARRMAAPERPRLAAGFAAEPAAGAASPRSFCCRSWLLTLPDCAPGQGVFAQVR